MPYVLQGCGMPIWGAAAAVHCLLRDQAWLVLAEVKKEVCVCGRVRTTSSSCAVSFVPGHYQ